MREGLSFWSYHTIVPHLPLRNLQNLAAWEEAKAEIAKIPDHPNRIPDDEAGKTTTRRDSTATVNGR